MKVIRNYVSSSGLKRPNGDAAQTGDTVRLYLDIVANPTFPDTIQAKIVYNITKTKCCGYSYSFEYDYPEMIRVCDILDVEVLDCCSVLAEQIEFIPTVINVQQYGASPQATGEQNRVAFNTAIADAFEAGGGEIYVPSGHYKFSGTTEGITNSILTCPQDVNYFLSRKKIRIVGELVGYMTDGYENIGDGGVALDFTECESEGINPSAIAFGRYVLPPEGPFIDDFNNLNVEMDHLMVVTAPGPMHGINGHNVLNLQIGDNIAVHVQGIAPPVSLLQPSLADPTGTGSCGILFPAVLNNIIVDCGSCVVSGFEFGIVSGEHCFFRRPSVIFCKVGLLVPRSSHLTSGHLSLENCAELIRISWNEMPVLNLEIQGEISDLPVWWQGTHGLLGSMNAEGWIIYSSFNKQLSEPDFPIEYPGKLRFYNLRSGEWTRVDTNLMVVNKPLVSDSGQVVFLTGGSAKMELSMRPGDNYLSVFSYTLDAKTVEFKDNGVTGIGRLQLNQRPSYADDAAAAADGSLLSGELYRVGSERILRQKA